MIRLINDPSLERWLTVAKVRVNDQVRKCEIEFLLSDVEARRAAAYKGRRRQEGMDRGPIISSGRRNISRI